MAWLASLSWSAPNKYLFKLSLISLVVLVLDQITKRYAVYHFGSMTKQNVLGEFLQWTLVFNEGGAFSTKLGPTLFYTFASLAVMIFVLNFLYREAGKSRLLDIALSLIIGGALGNLLDRVRFGSVIDWIDVDFFDIHIPSLNLLFFDTPAYDLTRWPVFNIADSAVTVGMVLLVIAMIISSRKAERAAD